MTVIIDSVAYVPLADIAKISADETAKALLRMFVNGYYIDLECTVTGGSVRPRCDCSICQGYRMTVQFLGGCPPCGEETDPGFKLLEEATR